jgi:hypothetical protein
MANVMLVTVPNMTPHMSDADSGLIALEKIQRCDQMKVAWVEGVDDRRYPSLHEIKREDVMKPHLVFLRQVQSRISERSVSHGYSKALQSMPHKSFRNRVD